MADDLSLFERWRAGDRAAGQALLERHIDSLYRFFRNKCPADAEELAQATLFACVASKAPFRGQSSFRTYLFSIARNKLCRYLRDRRRDLVVDPSITSVAEVITSARSALARNQTHHALLDALRQLPIDQQTLLELYYWDGLSTEELGQVFEVRAGTIQVWLFRARTRLRALLATRVPQLLEQLEDEARKVAPRR